MSDIKPYRIIDNDLKWPSEVTKGQNYRWMSVEQSVKSVYWQKSEFFGRKFHLLFSDLVALCRIESGRKFSNWPPGGAREPIEKKTWNRSVAPSRAWIFWFCH